MIFLPLHVSFLPPLVLFLRPTARQSCSFGGGGWWVGYAIVDGSLGPYDVCGQSIERNLTLSDRVGRRGGAVPAPAVRRVAAVTATSFVVVDIAMVCLSSLMDGGSRIHDEQKISGDLWLSQHNLSLFVGN